MRRRTKYGIIFLSRTSVRSRRTEKTCAAKGKIRALWRNPRSGCRRCKAAGKAAVSLRQKDRASSFAHKGVRPGTRRTRRRKEMRALRILRAEPLAGFARFVFVYRGKESYGRDRHAGEQRRQRRGVGALRAGTAVLHRVLDERPHGLFPVPQNGLLAQAHHRCHFHQQGCHHPHQQRGYGHQPVPEHVHRAGGHHRHRQHRGLSSGCGSWHCLA